jgi:signal transduction histidine kinase
MIDVSAILVGLKMNYTNDKSKIYLNLVLIALTAFAIPYILNGQKSLEETAVYLVLFVLFILGLYEPMLQFIRVSFGKKSPYSELGQFSTLFELNQKLQKMLGADEVFSLIKETFEQKMQITRTVILFSTELPSKYRKDHEGNDCPLKLKTWGDSRNWAFHSEEFEKALLPARNTVIIGSSPSPEIQQALEETATNIVLPVVQNDEVLCVILLNRSAFQNKSSEFEIQMLGYLCSQLVLILDRIRIYARVMKKTAMEHAEKVGVMQSLSANIAHEMRTPLSGIRASISGLEEYLPQLLESHSYGVNADPARFSPIRENHFNSLLAMPRRIKLMIDQANNVIDMLLMNLRENALDRKSMRPLSAADLVSQAVDRYPFKAGQREKLLLNLQQDFIFLGVESLGIYVLFNLLKNAYYSLQSAQKGVIEITLLHEEEFNVLKFRDSGLGIDAAIINKVFDGFFTTKSDGTGAGLAFCKRTVQSFGGKIECVSEQGEFAEFVISLPIVDTGNITQRAAVNPLNG